jgi:hypothetical protein
MTDDCIYTKDVVLDKDGYPRIKWKKKLWRLNRLIYTLSNGQIPEGMVVGHKCNNKGCINANHLYLTTAQENSTHAARDGLYFNGYHNKNIESAAKDWLHVCEMYHVQGYSQKSIGKMYDVSQARISEVLRKHKDKYMEYLDAR